MGTVENQLSMLGDAVTSQQSGSHPGNHGMLDPTQVENLLARITLAENKIAIMEAQVIDHGSCISGLRSLVYVFHAEFLMKQETFCDHF